MQNHTPTLKSRKGIIQNNKIVCASLVRRMYWKEPSTEIDFLDIVFAREGSEREKIQQDLSKYIWLGNILCSHLPHIHVHVMVFQTMKQCHARVCLTGTKVISIDQYLKTILIFSLKRENWHVIEQVVQARIAFLVLQKAIAKATTMCNVGVVRRIEILERKRNGLKIIVWKAWNL